MPGATIETGRKAKMAEANLAVEAVSGFFSSDASKNGNGNRHKVVRTLILDGLPLFEGWKRSLALRKGGKGGKGEVLSSYEKAKVSCVNNEPRRTPTETQTLCFSGQTARCYSFARGNDFTSTSGVRFAYSKIFLSY